MRTKSGSVVFRGFIMNYLQKNDKDKKEIEQVFLEYYTPICKYCALRMPKHISYSEDIANEAFVLLCKKWHKLEKRDIRAWLYRTADVLIKEFFRKNKKEADNLEYIEKLDAATDLTYEQDFENISDDDIEIIKNRILNELSDSDKKLFTMNFIEKLPHKDIGGQLLISEEAVKKRVYRLKQKIISKINEKTKGF